MKNKAVKRSVLGFMPAALNGFPKGVSESLMKRLAKTGFGYELSAWKEGADGFPVPEWK